MNILVISDLHLDTGDKFGTYQWDSNELIDVIENLREFYSIDKIILNGDIFELYKYNKSEIVKNQARIVEYLKQDFFVYITGNHDFLSDDGVDHYDIINSKKQSIHIEHGHNADFLNGTKLGRFVSKLFFTFFKKLIRFRFFLNLYFRIVEFGDEVDRIPKKYNSYKYLKYALRKLKEHDVVILGHTHKIETHHTYYLNKKKRYLNCGTCSLGRFQGIVMDTESLKYELIKMDKASAKHEGKESLLENLDLMKTA